MAMHTGQNFAKIAKDAERDYYLSAEEAKNYGLIDKVVVKLEGPKKIDKD